MATLRLPSSNVESENTRGRLYIDHGRGEEKNFRPHNQNINVQYTECGPDWSSKIRTNNSYSNGEHQTHTFFPPLLHLRRHNPPMTAQEKHQVTGKRTLFEEHGHRHSLETSQEYSLKQMIGHRASTGCGPRNDGVGTDAGHFYAVEFSRDFHKNNAKWIRQGRSPSVSAKEKRRTPHYKHPTKSYRQKQREKQLAEEIDEVKKLEDWKPEPKMVSVVQ